MTDTVHQNPYIGTSADSHLNDNLTTEGGNCYDFGGSSYIPEDVLSDNTININLIPIPCFNGKPIINNDILDKPWNPPPPVTTGCYPLRARAQTVSDDDDPSGISAEFVENPLPGKCFPILDIKLNLKPIVTDVLGIIIPGGGGGGSLPEPLGCCCDEFGSWYSVVDGCYSGRIGDCIGMVMPATNPACCHQWDSPGCAVGGIGVRWVQYDASCNMCSSDFDCCLQPLRQKWSVPQVLGIGMIGQSSALGVYAVLTTIPTKVAGVESSTGTIDEVVNIMESNDRECIPIGGNKYWVPGVGMSILDGGPSDSEYPEGFSPQNICPGTWVTLYAVTKPGWADMNLNNIPTPEEFDHGGLEGAYALRAFFSHPFAHDGNCD